MRSLIAKFAVVAGVGAAALAVPATSAFAGTTPVTPSVTTTSTPDTHTWGHDGNKGDDNGRDQRLFCKPEIRFFSNTQDNSWGRNNGRDDNNWGRDCRDHHQNRCVKCVTQDVFFNVRKGSTWFTETSGPTLTPGELLKYNGLLYTVGNVWGTHFKLSLYGTTVRAHASHWHAHATTVCPVDHGHGHDGHGDHGHDHGPQH